MSSSSTNNKSLFVFGLGYSSTQAALAFSQLGYSIAGTVRSQEAADSLISKYAEFTSSNIFLFDGDEGWSASNSVPVEDCIKNATHMIISIPPFRSKAVPKDDEEVSMDPVLSHFQQTILDASKASSSEESKLEWVGYLSTIGVYGDSDGAVVYESNPTTTTVARNQRRIIAEKQWLDVGKELPVQVFRLAGIYGPGRGPLVKAQDSSKPRVYLPNRSFNRTHVDDITQVLLLSARKSATLGTTIFNVCDDEPAPGHEVAAFAHELLGNDVPPAVPWEEAEKGMSAMAKTFYAEFKVVSNAKLYDELDADLIHPTYRHGLLDQWRTEKYYNTEAEMVYAGVQKSLKAFSNESKRRKRELVIVANIGSLRPEPFLDLRKLSFALSEKTDSYVVPCSFRFSNRVDSSKLHDIPAKNFEMVLSDFVKRYPHDEKHVVIVPEFFGVSATLTDFLPSVVHKCWDRFVNETDVEKDALGALDVRCASPLIDMTLQSDDRVAHILSDRIASCLAQNESTTGPVHVLVLDHGTPNQRVHETREFVAQQLREVLPQNQSVQDVSMIATTCMERRDGEEYDFNGPLLETALEHYNITSGTVVVTLLFLSNGRHAGPGGDIAEILEEARKQHPQVNMLVTEPLGTHKLLVDIMNDRLNKARKEKCEIQLQLHA